MNRYHLPEPGDVVRDRDRRDDAVLVVIETHPETAASDVDVPEVGESVSVADLNPDYDDGAPVVDCVYEEAAQEPLSEWSDPHKIRAYTQWDDIAVYSFPADRLADTRRGEAK